MRSILVKLLLGISIIVVIGIGYFFTVNNKSDVHQQQEPQEINESEEKREVEAVKVAEKEIPNATHLSSDNIPYTVVADNLTVPWDMVFLPSGDKYITERSGTVVYMSGNGDTHRIPIQEVHANGEGGLLGIALHPLFNQNRYLYLYLSQQAEKGTINKVERFKASGNTLTDRTIIISSIPGAKYHDGGRIAFGPDGHLYITTGDATDPSLAQNKESLAGKILRVTEDGQVPPDNPFGTAVYSLGHRNPQGLAWDTSGALWSTEHGRSGVLSGLDEVNKIERGGNYGWPRLQGDEKEDGFIAPALHSGSTTWAPASAAFVGSTLFFGGLRGETLYAHNTQNGILRKFFKKEFGRIRTVIYQEEERALYFTTSNQDGRGTPREGDDKILRVHIDDLEI